MAGSGAGASYFLKLSIKRPAQIPGPALPLHRIRPGSRGSGSSGSTPGGAAGILNEKTGSFLPARAFRASRDSADRGLWSFFKASGVRRQVSLVTSSPAMNWSFGKSPVTAPAGTLTAPE